MGLVLPNFVDLAFYKATVAPGSFLDVSLVVYVPSTTTFHSVFPVALVDFSVVSSFSFDVLVVGDFLAIAVRQMIFV